MANFLLIAKIGKSKRQYETVEILTPLLIVFAISLAGLAGGIFLIYRENWAKIISKYLINFSIGALFGVVFLDLLPESIAKTQSVEGVLIFVLAGILLFYLLEKTFLWYHHHSAEHIWHKTHPPEEMAHSVGYLITFGDALHNFIDGLIIAAGFTLDFKLGVTTSLAVLFHEIPAEIGEFAVLLHAGFSRARIIISSIAAQMTAVVGFVIGFFYLSLFANFEVILASIASGSFIYIAATDLLPETHRERELGRSLVQVMLLIAGIVTIWLVGTVVPE